MSSIESPFGLKPAQHPSGCVRQELGTIESGYAFPIYQYQPVQIGANGTIEVTQSGEPVVGVFMGVEWTETDGRRRVGNRWGPNTVGSEIVAYYTLDKDIIYQVQADASVTQDVIGQTRDLVNSQQGNDITGLSEGAISATVQTNNDLRVIGVNPAADNEVGDDFTIVEVLISNWQYLAPTP